MPLFVCTVFRQVFSSSKNPKSRRTPATIRPMPDTVVRSVSLSKEVRKESGFLLDCRSGIGRLAGQAEVLLIKPHVLGVALLGIAEERPLQPIGVGLQSQPRQKATTASMATT